MKRIAWFLVFLLVVSFVPASVSAEKIDFSDLSLDQLIMIKTWVTEEIAERTKDKKEVRVPMGEYIIGTDIPSGTYTITCKDFCASVSVYSSSGSLIDLYFINENDSIGKINLQQGQIFKTTTELYFSAYKGLDF